ncbi:MAG TPA: DUF3750 domain-containing protein [Desulfuromonadales bacterium]|nr:DUF3750 domain-containing protein [Desulfuromonadales bacterium]
MKFISWKTIIYFLVLALTVLALANCSGQGDWRTASREPAGIAPPAEATEEPVLHVYAARAWGWRGWFAVHTWIAVKRSGAEAYTVYEVVGWRAKRGKPVLRIAEDHPDRYWFGEKPRLLKEHRGAGVDHLIEAVDQAARSYPWPREYQVFPGPNSNTFTAWVAEQVPELQVDLPWRAIGSGYVN